jgi:hypothetical protein
MKRLFLGTLIATMVCAGVLFATAQPLYQMPDVRSLKHLATRSSDHAPDIPGKETTMDFYSGTDGTIITVYSYRARNVAFSTHNNSDVQGSYRVFLDTTGKGLFQDIGKSQWQLPTWAR